jgi:uncharacterized protein YukJ
MNGLPLVDDADDYCIAVNVKSKKSLSQLLYLINDNSVHPLVDDLKELPFGYTIIGRVPGRMAMD